MSKIKIIDKNGEQNVLSERKLLSQLHNPFIVNIYFAFQDFMNLYLVMDYLSGGDLRYHLAKKKFFSEKETKFIIANIILGLEYIHNKNIIHRDIKPENLVCDINGYFRITDFGIAKINEKDNSSETSGTIGYMSPEVLFIQNHSFSVDFFALGIIGYEFIFGRRPYKGNSREEYKENILNFQAQIYKRDIKDYNLNYSFDCIKFINGLLIRNYKERLGFKNGVFELKNHPWMKDINWDLMKEKQLIAPFTPDKNKFNFDKKYCENIEKIDHDALGRYQQYINNELFSSIFEEYYYFNYIPKKLPLKEIMKIDINNYNNNFHSLSERNHSENKIKHQHINQNLFLYKNSANMLNLTNNKKISSKILYLSRPSESGDKLVKISKKNLENLSPNKTFNKVNLLQSDSFNSLGNNRFSINKMTLHKGNKNNYFNVFMDNSQKSIRDYKKNIMNMNYYNTNEKEYNSLSERNNDSNNSIIFQMKKLERNNTLNKFKGVFLKKDLKKKSKIDCHIFDKNLIKNKISNFSNNNDSYKNFSNLIEKNKNYSKKNLFKLSKKPKSLRFDYNIHNISDLQKKKIPYSNNNIKTKRMIKKINKTKIETINNYCNKPRNINDNDYEEVNSI